ncbi:hypothetical protein ACX1C1_04135 [Paenibacillus sp. strain BS8-2]
MRQIAFFEPDGETGKMHPAWLVLDRMNFDWTKTLYVNLETPFELLTLEEFDSDVASLSVPDFVFVRNPYDPKEFGINFLLLAEFVRQQAHADPEDLEIDRLVLRISDIEDSLQYSVRDYIQWGY